MRGNLDRGGPERSRGRGQAFTLEAIVASIVLIGSLLFALQVAGVTSLTAGTAGGLVVEQGENAAGGALDAARANGSVRPTLLYWDETSGAFHGVSEADENYYTVGPPTAFGAVLNRSLADWNLAYNVDLHYLDGNGTVRRQALVRNGVPSDDAARAHRTVTLYDDDRLRYANGSVSNTTVANASLYAPDGFPEDRVYNVVRVEVTVWPV